MRVLTLKGAVRLGVLLLAYVFGFGSFQIGSLTTTGAQTVPKSLEEGGPDATQRVKRNNWTVGVAGGQLSGTYMTFANELAEVLDDGDNLRVLPIVTYGAASNMDDLLYLKNVDVAVTQADVFEYFRTQRKISNLESRVNQKMPPNSGLHFVPIPFSKTFADYYTLGELTHKEYPSLVPEGQAVDTIAVPAVLAVFNWSKGTDRHRRVQRFVEGLFTKWDKLREPPRHPKWRDVNLAASVPGWARWSVADEMLRKIRPQDAEPQVASTEFSAFLKSAGSAATNLSQEQREALFREFMQWREKQQRNTQR